MKITEETRPEKDSSHLILIPEVFSAYALPFLNEIVLGVVKLPPPPFVSLKTVY